MRSACGSAFVRSPLPVDGYVWNVATVVADWAAVQAGFPVETPMIGLSMKKRARAAQAAKLWGYSRRQAVRLSISDDGFLPHELSAVSLSSLRSCCRVNRRLQVLCADVAK